MKAIFEKINEMQAAGIIGKYAIGDAVGGTFYLEPSATLDVDIFATLPMASGQVLLSLAPVYDYLQTHGGKLEGEYIVLDGWPVQFLPPADALDQELFSRPMNMGDVSTWLPSRCELVARGITREFCSLLNKTPLTGPGYKAPSNATVFLQSGGGSRAGILEELVSKEHMRKRLASLSFSEKIKILEKLRDRSPAIAASGLRRKKSKSSRQSVTGRLMLLLVAFKDT